ncbi:bifunctional diaminohydroxyphosphoribosylaminopyrimidine deaminase/5-amino-6-(5-phosphoribosylamino)uracil reductase RibD [Roseicitreum antarcticum]|nr:bifunctional diaminohydroxyphosphoribosylaminopyrimidine deaminase/5-amino-6-(5-phosphoribosylamino)uracil reductase RibD [Roseicitreum antarcticum]
MRLAISLGTRGLGRVWPNPAVGCVIVQGTRIVGRGWTQPGGRPHAERRALDQAGAQARGATAYVSLEPCAHHGKTPPCAQALIAAGVARVVTALTDPDPRVEGNGHAMLRAAGVEVIEGVCADAAHAANAGFLSRITRGRPLVTLKLALTLDGRIATATGESRWITGAAARRMVHGMRANHDAVLVGVGTALADDPDLRVRDLGVAHQPVRLIADSTLRLPPDSRLGRTARDVPVGVLHGMTAPRAAQDAWAATGARLIACNSDADRQLDMADALSQLAVLGLTRILCEGGGTLAATLLRQGLVDRLICISAGKVIGGDGISAVAPMGLRALQDAAGFDLTESRTLGDDVMHSWVRRAG